MKVDYHNLITNSWISYSEIVTLHSVGLLLDLSNDLSFTYNSMPQTWTASLSSHTNKESYIITKTGTIGMWYTNTLNDSNKVLGFQRPALQ